MLLLQKHQELESRLELHHLQRLQGIPTVSLLAGSTSVARELWDSWNDRSGRKTLAGSYRSMPHLFEEWVSRVARDCDMKLRQGVLAKVAALSQQTPGELICWLENTSDYQRECFWGQLPSPSEAQLLQWLLDLTDREKYLNDASGSILPVWLDTASLAAIAGGFAAMVGLLPEGGSLGIFLELEGDPTGAPPIGVLAELVQLAEAVPVLPIAVGLSLDLARELFNQGPESRVKAVLRHGWLEIPLPSRASLEQWLGDRGIGEGRRREAIVCLVERYGATEQLLQTAALLTEPDCQPATAEEERTYRSLAEQFLYQCLEARAATAGRFVPNERLEFPFGSRPVEVDLVARQARLAIEIDGYYHFQSRENYRRDRGKDYELQKHGYFVLRFLAEDVVWQLEEIFQRVEALLALSSTP